MTIERSHGKARPTLPRASDLPAAIPGPTGPRQRDGRGRFAAGNREGIGRGAKGAVRRLLGRARGLSDAAVECIARDAAALYTSALAELPSDGAVVRQLAASWARHTSLGGYFATLAAQLGPSTREGLAAEQEATRHGQRAERLAISMIDVAARLRAPTDTTHDAGEAPRVTITVCEVDDPDADRDP